uniref:Uncharacterized protein n=1 Tax=Oryza punctata TaxID=4537 RepID=A0A0E0LDS5_ORYPU
MATFKLKYDHVVQQITYDHYPLGAHFHDTTRCIFMSLYKHHGKYFWWQQRHSEDCALCMEEANFRMANFYISDRNIGRRFYRPSVIDVLKKHHAYNIIDASSGMVTTGCQLTRCMFTVLVDGLILMEDEGPDENALHGKRTF